MQEMISTAGMLRMQHLIVSVLSCNSHYKSFAIMIRALPKRCFCAFPSLAPVPVITVGRGADLAESLQ